MPPPPPTPHATGRVPFWGRLALVALAALALRVAYALTAAGEDNLPVEAGDRFFFLRGAELLADGHGFAHPAVWPTAPEAAATAAHPPLWIAVLAPLAALGALDEQTARLAGALAGAAAVVLAGALGRQVGGDRAGLLTAGAAALYPAWVVGDTSGMSEALYVALVAAGVLAVLVARERRRLALGVLAGAGLGLAALTRTEALLLVPLVAWPLLWGRGGGRAWTAPLVATLAAAAVVAPWTLRNALVLERFVPVSTNVDTVVAGANCPEAYFGRDTGTWVPACLFRATGRVAPGTYDEGALAGRWRAAGLRYARGEAGRLAAVVVPVRVLRTWRLWQPLRAGRLTEGENRAAAALGSVAFLALLLPLGLIGLLRAVPRGDHRLLVMGLAAAVTLTSAIGWGAPRFARPAELGLLVCAGALVAAWTSRRPRRLAGRARRKR